MGTFALARLQSLRAALNGPNGRAWATSLGAAQDAEALLLREVGRSRSIQRCSDDALDPVIGSAYRRARAPREMFDDGGNEGNDAYRARLSNAWPFWESAPTTGATDPDNLGLASLFDVYATISRRSPVVVMSAYAASPAYTWFSEVFFVWPGPLFQDNPWGFIDGGGSTSAWGDGGLWGLAYDRADPFDTLFFGVADLDWFKREIRLCKGAQAKPVWIAVGTGLDNAGWSAMWGDGGLWGDGGTWGNPAASSIVYLALSHVWGEEQWYGGGPGLWGTPGDTWEDSFEPPSGGW
jgi:hypothetical protein